MLAIAVAAWVAPLALAGPEDRVKIPDLTRGGTVPKEAKHDWNLGPTGLRGWMHCHDLVTADARQIRVTDVAAGSPASREFKVGDVILGVGSKPFSFDPRTEFGRAVTAAESEAGRGKLALTRWRQGETTEVVLTIPVLGDYGPTAPFNCPKSRRLLEQGCDLLAERMKEPGYDRLDPIPRSLNALALLAGGKDEHLPLVRREARWASGFSTDSMQTWYYGYCMILIAEYSMATGDQSVLPGLRRLALEASRGQSAVGSWGHGFALPSGRLGGYGMMNSPGVPLTIGLALAREAGVNDPELPRAIELSARLLRFYIGKGAIPYGDHHPWIETHEDNGKCGMATVLFDLLGEPKGAEFFSRMSLASHGPERDCGHCGNYFNMLWAMPGVARSGPNAAGAWMTEFGSWSFDFARRWDGAYPHQGPPENEPDSFDGWDATGGYLLAYAMPLKKIRLTGKGRGTLPPLDVAQAGRLIDDGRHWNNRDRIRPWDKLSTEQLIDRLRNWSPVVRDRAAMALAGRKDVPVSNLVRMLDDPSLVARYGACRALGALGERAAGGVEPLRKALGHGDLWLRVLAADALAKMGSAAAPAVPQLLELLAAGPTQDDPRGMQQRYLTFALFDGEQGGMLSRSLDRVNRESLYRAVKAGLGNQDGRARGSFASVYRKLSLDDIKPLLPAILQAVNEPAPSGEMFADTIRVEGLKVLANHRIEEGIAACVHYTREQNQWSSENRTPELMKILVSYGSHAKSTIPELRRLADYFEKDEPNFPRELMKVKAKSVREAIRRIEAAKDAPPLTRITAAAIRAETKAGPAKGAGRPVKVFLLAGQSNMEGAGFIAADPKRNGGKGSLEFLTKDGATAARFKHLLDAEGRWAVRDDVLIHYLGRRGKLTVGYGAKEDRIGPELGFGWVIGDAFDESVLLVKLAWGGKSLAKDFRPPTSGGEVGPFYREIVTRAKVVLSGLKTEFPELGDVKPELSGFGWHQGWNDRVNQAFNDEYESNMANFIRDVRKDLGAPNLPFVIAETGMTGPTEKHPRALSLMTAQAAVAERPEFRGNVAFVSTRSFWRDKELSPNNQGYHWNSNAETYYLIGEAMGKAMKDLCQREPARSTASPSRAERR
jgi:hypothetical protein